MSESVSRTGENPYFASAGRLKVLKFVVASILLIFIGRLAQLQLVEGAEYRNVSEAQAIKQVRIAPFRGNLYDRNGILFVHNAPSFSITITPHEFHKDVMPLLSSLLMMDSSVIYKIMDKYKTYSPFIPVKIVPDADFELVARVEEYLEYMPGVDIIIESKRLYDFQGNMAHLLGYTREITPEELERMKYYMPGDIVGRAGIEKTYETVLRGKEGIQFVAVDKLGRKVASFDKGKKDVAQRSGFDLHMTIDIRLQELAEQLLEGKRGSVVAIDPRNGEILVYATKPDYDPRLFAGKTPPEYYRVLANDPGKPLLNRGISSRYPPGSTWKMLMALAALQEGLIDTNFTISCPGGLAYGGRFFKCHGTHGRTNVIKAIQASCNTFFYHMGLKLGLDKVISWGRSFGFGLQTTVDLPNESSGNYPLREGLMKRYRGYIPKGILLNYGIGQGEVLATPMQMALYTATIANKGYIIKPHLVKAIFNNITNRKEFFSYDSLKVPIDKKYFDIVHEGMYRVVNVPGGTAKVAKLDDIAVCGKTGTAQNPHGQDHSWFVCFAPRENPKIAMAVMVENAGFGSTVAAPIAKKIMDSFFHPDSLKIRPEPVPKSVNPFALDSARKLKDSLLKEEMKKTKVLTVNKRNNR